MAELASAQARGRRGLEALMKGLSPGAPGGVVGLVLLLFALVAVFSLAVPGRFLTV
jgi:hypothetical protein